LQLLTGESGDEPQAASLRQTVDAYRRLLDWLDRTVSPEHSHDLVAIHRHFYEGARKESGLQARAVTLALKDFVQRRRGKVVEGLPLDEKLYGLKGIELVSIATLKGRITIPFRVAGYGAEWNGKSPARLIVSPSYALRASEGDPSPQPSPTPSAQADFVGGGEGDFLGSEFNLLIAVDLAVVEGLTRSG
jgi:hypothetical protein